MDLMRKGSDFARIRTPSKSPKRRGGRSRFRDRTPTRSPSPRPPSSVAGSLTPERKPDEEVADGTDVAKDKDETISTAPNGVE